MSQNRWAPGSDFLCCNLLSSCQLSPCPCCLVPSIVLADGCELPMRWGSGSSDKDLIDGDNDVHYRNLWSRSSHPPSPSFLSWPLWCRDNQRHCCQIAWCWHLRLPLPKKISYWWIPIPALAPRAQSTLPALAPKLIAHPCCLIIAL